MVNKPVMEYYTSDAAALRCVVVYLPSRDLDARGTREKEELRGRRYIVIERVLRAAPGVFAASSARL